MREQIIKGKRIVTDGEILPTDKDEWCLRAVKERLIHAHERIVKPCTVSDGIDILEVDPFKDYIKDIRNKIPRKECHTCVNSNASKTYRDFGNQLWLIPGHGNSHTEIILSSSCNSACIYCNSRFSDTWKEQISNTDYELPVIVKENKHNYFAKKHVPTADEVNIAMQYVQQVGADPTKMACIGIYGGEPGLEIISEDHVGRVLSSFYSKNDVWNRRIRYDFNTGLNYSQEHTKSIIDYLKEKNHEYPFCNIIVQPSFESIETSYEFIRYGNTWKQFENNLDLFLNETDFAIEIQARINNVSLKGLTDFLKYCNDKAKSRSNFSIDLGFIDVNKIFSVDMLNSEFDYHVQRAFAFIKNENIFIKNKDHLRHSLITLEKKCKLNLLDKKTAGDALDFYLWIEQERGMRLQDINQELYNYFVKISEN